LNRDDKVDRVRELNETFNRANFAVVADYRGLKVTELEKLRSELRQNQSQIQVAKNTLFKLAVKDTEYEGLSDSFSGTTAITFSFEEPVATAKILADFAKEFDSLQIRNGVMDGKLLSAEEVKAIAKLPSREQLLGQLCGVLSAVPTNFVRTLNGVAGNLVCVLQAVKEQKEN
jgi:large subunit ribosomal protein L10